jgi:hypothetical protein
MGCSFKIVHVERLNVKYFINSDTLVYYFTAPNCLILVLLLTIERGYEMSWRWENWSPKQALDSYPNQLPVELSDGTIT